MIGTTISHYEILEKLGEGGMGVVYKAEDTKLKREVALKFLPRYISSNKEERQRFEIEAQAAASLNHPNIAHIYAIEEINNEIFIVMEFVDGKELKEVIEDYSKGTLPINTITDYAAQIANGLEAAHKIGIVHRDIKTQNIMITKDNKVKIMDFGLAKVKGVSKLTKIGTTVGTTAYMSPEQAKGEQVDHRTDIWSFGIVLYEMLTGELPFKGDYEQAIIYSVINEEPELIQKIRNNIPQQIENIISQTLNKKFQNRYNSLSEVIEELSSISEKPAIAKYKPLTYLIFGRKHRQALYITTVILLISFAIAFYLWFNTNTDSKQISIALLPLKSISNQSDQDWFTDGMTEALITDLAKISGLRVISRSSVMKFKGTDKTSSEIAQALGISYLIEGSVIKINDQIKITTQLIDAAKDEYVWAQEYERDFKDILSLQSEVAQAIVEQIKVKITPYEQTLLAAHQKINPEAYEAYLRGNFYWNKINRQALETALNYYNLAREIDPESALAYAGIASVWIVRAQNGFESTQIAYGKGKLAALRALELDSTLAEVHSMYGGIKLWGEWSWKEAENEFRKSIQLNPNLAEARAYYSHLLFVLKRFDEADEQNRIAMKLDPFNTLYQGFYAMGLMYEHRYDDVISMLEKNRETEPNGPLILSTLKSAYHQKGAYKKALEIWRTSFELNKDYEAVEVLDQGNRKGGYSVALRSVAELMIKRSKTKFVTPWQIATLYTRAGIKKEALDWLEKAYEIHDPNMPYLSIDPIFDYLRNEPRIKNLIMKIGL